MLYLVATPIGNLSDITYRAIDTLKSCDYILCEDTRHSQILLNHYQIHKPLKSYHKFNELFRIESVIQDLEEGKKICLISDAGTPGISDPGTELIQACIKNNISVTAIPGPCAAIQALVCSGFPLERFQFCGFLPRKENELNRELQFILTYPGVSICYESPHRLINVLEHINSLSPHTAVVIAREMTKKYEEFIRGSPQELLNYWKSKESIIKGEIVLLISPDRTNQQQDWSAWTPEEHVTWIEKTYSLSRKEAIKMAAEQRGVPKRELYKDFF